MPVQLIPRGAATIVNSMNEPAARSAVDVELRRLERRLDELVATVDQLKEENRALRQRQDTPDQRARQPAAEERAGARAGRGDDRPPQGDGAGLHERRPRLAASASACSTANTRWPARPKSAPTCSTPRSTSTARCARSAIPGKVVGLDRIAVIAALNLANELIKLRKHGTVARGRPRRAPEVPARARGDRARERPATGTLRVRDSPNPRRFGAACGVRHGPGYLSTLM